MLNKPITELVTKLALKLSAQNYTVSCAESCTGGGIAYALTSVAGSSSWFKQSYVTYCNLAKQTILGVNPETLDQHGAVSRQTVEQMAVGCAQQAHADLAIAVSGIAGPDGGSDEKPVGLVWFGFWAKGEVSTEMKIFSGDRDRVRTQAIEFALQHALRLA